MTLLVLCWMAALSLWLAQASPIQERWTSPGSRWQEGKRKRWALNNTSPSMWPNSQMINIIVKLWMAMELNAQSLSALMSHVRLLFLFSFLWSLYVSPRKAPISLVNPLPSLSQLLQRSYFLPAVWRFCPRSDVPVTLRGTRFPPWFGSWLASLSITLLISQFGK